MIISKKDLEAANIILNENKARVNNLLSLFNVLKSDLFEHENRYKYSDILRAVIMVAHSSFETYLRTILLHYVLLNYNDEILKKLNRNQTIKYEIFELKKNKNIKISTFIDSIISNLVEKQTFNDFSQIKTCCDLMSIDISKFDRAKEVEELLKRRHKIVHESDRSKKNDGSRKLDRLTSEWVSNHINAIFQLSEIIKTNCYKKI